MASTLKLLVGIENFEEIRKLGFSHQGAFRAGAQD